MSLRLRLTLVAAIVVAVVLSAASMATYFLMHRELYKQVDSTLTQDAAQQVDHPHVGFHDFGPYANDYVALVTSTGTALNYPFPVTPAVKEAAKGTRNRFFFVDTTVESQPVRAIVVPINGGGAVVVFQTMQDVIHELNRLRLILLLVSIGGVGAAALAGALVSRATLAPVRRLTGAAERIAQTGDPSERVPVGGRGELARLGTAFNTMLEALEESIETQRRFVADASHELRTPLTSLQTNIDVLKQQEKLDPAARNRLFADLQRESSEMRNLIAGLLELARGGDTRAARETVQLDELVDGALDRARSRFPHIAFEARLEPTEVEGVPERLDRAVWNLLENAGKWSDPGSTVEVTLEHGELRVRDHGPGIAAEDRPHVFERFYRAAAARSLPGSGLGLSIVHDVAEAHGGSVSAEEAPGGGALLRLRLRSS